MNNVALNGILNLLDAIANPQELQGKALNALAQKNPQTASEIARLIKSGANPSEAIAKYAREGKINPEQLDKLRSVYNMLKKRGLKKFSIPDSVWEEAKRAMTCNTPEQNWF